jgi:Undecaprenyl-phosphate galactose phosphotransferase WbaP
MKYIPKKEGKPWLSHSYSLRMNLWFILSDLLSLSIAGVSAYFLRILIGEKYQNSAFYLQLLWIPLVFILLYAVSGLYPGVGITPVDELRRVTTITSSLWIAITAILFLTKSGESYSREVFLFYWFFSILLIPILRFYARRIGIKFGFWGEPVAIIGFGEYARKTLHFLVNNRFFGYIPVLIVEEKSQTKEINFEGQKIPKIDTETLLNDKKYLNRQGINTAIFVPEETPGELSKAIGSEDIFGLKHLILISKLGWVGGSAVVPVDMEGILGLSAQRNLLNPYFRLLKRSVDLLITLVAGIISLPILLICAVLIRLDSPGPIFYFQKRVGYRGKEIRVCKFRTMVQKADIILEDYLCANPDLRDEWNSSHKIKNDPRVTRLGKFLRKTSLDEIPQMWNVLIGEMSWVGPRPIVEDEIVHYQESFSLYTQVRPGITGLWQVSGRSSTSYKYRVNLDEYYIRHWSLWLDIYILLRTVRSVLSHEGAW